MTTVYGVSHAEGTSYVPTLAEARRLARELSEEGDLYVQVARYGIADRPRRELFCALLNTDGFADVMEEVAV